MNESKLFKVFVVYLIFVLIANAQSGGTFEITQSIVGGGGQQSSGGTFSLDGTIGQPLANGQMSGAGFSLSSGFWSPTPSFAGQGVESDVAGRPNGDGVIQSNDVVQVQRFQIGLDRPFQTNEIQRTDSAPLSTHGDGQIQSNDVVQAQRFQIGLDGQQTAAGPTDLVGGRQSSETGTSVALPREVRVESTNAVAGQGTVVVNTRVDALGDESAYGFNLAYQTAAFTNASVAIGTAGGSRFCNTTVAGLVSCSINNFPDDLPGSSTDQIGEIHAGNNQLLVRITLTLAAIPPSGASLLTLTNVNTSNDAAQALPISSQNGAVMILGPLAAAVSVGGRVLTAYGQGMPNATMTIADQSGTTRQTRTSSFGYFKFEEIPVGETYLISVSAKGFTFSQPTQVRAVFEEIADVDFIADN
ncbi:hypothetical protein BH10ACI1_BH10ACI1_34820 [soil metagenome]